MHCDDIWFMVIEVEWYMFFFVNMSRIFGGRNM